MSFAGHVYERLARYNGYDKIMPSIGGDFFSFTTSIMPSLYISYIVVVTFCWVVFYTFNPDIVKTIHEGETVASDKNPPDSRKCLFLSLVVAALFIWIAWMLRRCN